MKRSYILCFMLRPLRSYYRRGVSNDALLVRRYLVHGDLYRPLCAEIVQTAHDQYCRFVRRNYVNECNVLQVSVSTVKQALRGNTSGRKKSSQGLSLEVEMDGGGILR